VLGRLFCLVLRFVFVKIVMMLGVFFVVLVLMDVMWVWVNGLRMYVRCSMFGSVRLLV